MVIKNNKMSHLRKGSNSYKYSMNAHRFVFALMSMLLLTLFCSFLLNNMINLFIPL